VDCFEPKDDPLALSLHTAFTILIALLPAALTMWWGRAVSRHLDDPALPERLVANRRRTGAVLGLSIGLLVVMAIDHLAWALSLLVLARMAAAYPLRKALYNETWSRGAYFSFFIRLVVSIFGFWILIGTMPTLTMLAGSRDWIAAGALGRSPFGGMRRTRQSSGWCFAPNRSTPRRSSRDSRSWSGIADCPTSS
jgi:hypothetical protein